MGFSNLFLTLAVFGKTFRNFWSSMLFNFVPYLAFLTIFDSSVTNESFVDETRVWRKYEVSILVSMIMSLFT